ncbi:unnamed protein product [Trichobilharzia szidati]|nr:unnamed protein product [Trichobilharzia szidati]
MDNIDSYLGDFLENDDGDQENNSKLQNMRSGVIFLVDCTPTMLGLMNNNNNNNTSINSSGTTTSATTTATATTTPTTITTESGFNLSLLCCQTFQQNKALHSPFDMIGLVLMRTKESSPDMKNIMVLQPLGLADATRILEIERIRQLKPEELEKRFGTIVALWTCQNLFITCSKSFGIKHIFLFTDDPDPVNRNANLKRRAVAKMADMRQYGIELEVIPIKLDKSQFQYELFYDELLEDEMSLTDLNKSRYRPDPTERLDELLSRVNCHELRRSRVCRLPFHLGPSPELALGVSVYCLIRPVHLPTPIWLSSNDNKPITVRRQYYKGIDPYGSYDPVKDALADHDLVRGIKLDGRYVCFDKDEINEAMKNIAPVGIHLLGFISMKFLKRFYYIRPAQFIYPDEASIHGSCLWFTALLNRCLHRKLLAIAVYVQRKGQFPRLIALYPQAEEVNEVKVQTMPPGFHIIFLPFADDFRDIDIPSGEIADESQVDIAKAMIRKLMVPFSPGQIENPLLQRYYSLLEALAFNRESQAEIVDHTLPKIGAMKRRASVEIEAFRQCFNLEAVNSLKKAYTSQSTDSNSSQSVKPFLSEDELKAAVRLGQLNKYTVTVLRDTIKSLDLKISTTGRSKKSDIIQQIMNHFK